MCVMSSRSNLLSAYVYANELCHADEMLRLT